MIYIAFIINCLNQTYKLVDALLAISLRARQRRGTLVDCVGCHSRNSCVPRCCLVLLFIATYLAKHLGSASEGEEIQVATDPSLLHIYFGSRLTPNRLHGQLLGLQSYHLER